MHETRLVRDLVLKIDEAAAGSRVTRLRLSLGPDSHMDQDGFSSQFEVFASGTVAEKAELVFVDPDPSDAPAAIRLIDMEVI